MPPGRGPGASRVHACEAGPRAPHPIPLAERLMTAPFDGPDIWYIVLLGIYVKRSNYLSSRASVCEAWDPYRVIYRESATYGSPCSRGRQRAPSALAITRVEGTTASHMFCRCDDLAALRRRTIRVSLQVSGRNARTKSGDVLGHEHPPRAPHGALFLRLLTAPAQPIAHLAGRLARRQRKRTAIRKLKVARVDRRLAFAGGAAFDHQLGPDRKAGWQSIGLRWHGFSSDEELPSPMCRRI